MNVIPLNSGSSPAGREGFSSPDGRAKAAVHPLTLSRPQLAEHLLPIVIDDRTAMLVCEDDHVLLTGRVYPRLLPLLNGTRTTAELMAALRPELSPQEALFALHVLHRDGHVIDADPGPRELTAFWHERGVRLADAQTVLDSRSISVSSIGGEPAADVVQALSSSGLILSDSNAALEVVLATDYQHHDLDAVNTRMLAAGRSWMLVKPRGRVPWIGPLFEPGKTGCWRCLTSRLEANRQLQAFLRRRLSTEDTLTAASSRHPAAVAATAAIAAMEISRFLVTGQSRLSGRLLSLDLSTLETTHHILTRRPQCPACGDVDLLRKPRPVVLASAPKGFVGDGGHRTTLPELTIERFKDHVSPITGVVTSLLRFDAQAANGLTYTYSAGHNFAMAQDDLFFLMMNLRNRSGGKGCTDAQARASAICEAIERYSGVWRGEEYAKRASYADFDPGEALHPNDLMGFSEQQYAARESWNDGHSRLHQVPRTFDSQLTMDWTAIWSLTEKRFKWIPSSYSFFGHPDFRETLFCFSDSNGNAAGNTLEEAILQGFMELVERDAVAIWWYNRLRRPRVDLDSFHDPYIKALSDCYRDMGREFWVLDITSDLGIPTFAAVSRRLDRPAEDILVGFGAHFDARVALLRALTEINQFLPCVSEVDAQGNTIYWFHDQEAINWWQTATLQSEPYLLPSDEEPTRANPGPISKDLKDDVEQCVEILRQRGMEMFVLDQTQPDVGLSVVKVMVPGLRHFWKRFAPGRLYDVPVAMGWQAEPTPEEKLNPIGIFF
ncbi:MAG TPA: TOMM precursor leader peptide-binding protein [Thermoanaerobaculia bacterium]|nr:TOMM precursor leader peptide-binding protein [Thermoanaerobaculia bacterium]